jgi:capsular polysaccharide transport system permease protein
VKAIYKKFDWLFLVVVMLPTTVAFVYYFMLASNVYISESRFVVRSPDKPSQTPIGVLLKGAGFSNAGDEIFVVRDFIVSRDALKQLNRDGFIRRAYSAPTTSVFDRFNPFGWSSSEEQLYKYYRKQVGLDYDASSSILSLTVRGFDPRSPVEINRRLLEISEQLVNRLNTRGQQDLIRFAGTEVAEARARAQASGQALAEFRNRAGVVDPEKQATAQLQMISKLQDDLIETRTMLRQLQTFTPANPQIPALRVRARGLEQEIQRSLGAVYGAPGSIAANSGHYQRLLLDSQIADKQLTAAMASYSEAVNEARRKQAYVERIVQPNVPDYPLEPRRLRGVLAIAALGFVVWLVLRMLLAGVREHQD